MNKKSAIEEMMENMSEEDLAKVYEQARKEMGGDSLPIDLICTTSTSNWWKSASQNERDCLQILFSRFCLTLIDSAACTGGQEFNLRCIVALAILGGDISVTEDGSGDIQCDPNGGTTNEDTKGKTFH